jgi:thioesterase domain-containing protein
LEGDPVSPGEERFNPELLAETERFLHEKIPITLAMGVRVESYENGRFVITAPIAKNHNHLQTAFGGSLSAMATLAGYGFLWLALSDPEVHVVIKDSAIQFRRPVRGDIRAICGQVDPHEMEKFKSDFERKGKARISLRVQIVEKDEIAVEFQGTFVAVRHHARN